MRMNKAKLYSCVNALCRNPSEVFNGKCEYCQIAPYGEVPPLVEWMANQPIEDVELKDDMSTSLKVKRKPGRPPKDVTKQ